jgi:excisionase family DNA binding protein
MQMDTTPKRETLSTGEVAEMLGVNRKTVSRLVDRGDLRASRLTPRSHRRIRPEAVLELASASSQRSSGDDG